MNKAEVREGGRGSSTALSAELIAPEEVNIPLPKASVKLFRRRWWPSDIMPASAADRGREMLMAERSGAGAAQDLDRVLADLRALSEDIDSCAVLSGERDLLSLHARTWGG